MFGMRLLSWKAFSVSSISSSSTQNSPGQICPNGRQLSKSTARLRPSHTNIRLGADRADILLAACADFSIPHVPGPTGVVAALVEAGAALDVQTRAGATALMVAAQSSRTVMAVALIRAGAALDLKCKPWPVRVR